MYYVRNRLIIRCVVVRLADGKFLLFVKYG